VGHNIRYYAGFRFPAEEIHEGQVLLPYTRGEDLVVIPATGDPALVMSRADEELVRRQTWIRDVRSLRENYLGVESSKGLALLVRDVLRDRGIVEGQDRNRWCGSNVGTLQCTC